MSINENVIRDKLASNLEVLESGLTLIETEFRLSNDFGAGGRIDILAKDEYGQYVVIELKKSDQAARQGIHELFKYLSILSFQLGVEPKSIRAMLVSTTWHELKVPFSEYLKITPYHTKGIQLEIDELGNPISSLEVDTAPDLNPISYSPMQKIYFYRSEFERERNITKISDALKKVGVIDHFLLTCDHDKSDKRVIYPYAIYIVFSSPLLTLCELEASKLKEAIDWDDELDQLDENFLVAMPHSGFSYDDAEIGYPEKLKNISDSWNIKVSLRNGRFTENRDLVSDDDLIKKAMYIEGGSSFYLTKMISPQFSQQWLELIANMEQVALGNVFWSKSIPAVMKSIELSDENAKVSCHIFNSANTPISIFGLTKGVLYYLPTFQLISKESEGVRYVFSLFSWGGRLVSSNPLDFFERVYGSVDTWLTYQHFGEQFTFDDKARNILNIDFPLFEVWAPNHGEKVVSKLKVNKNQEMVRYEIKQVPEGDVMRFISQNRAFLSNYSNLMESIGLR